MRLSRALLLDRRVVISRGLFTDRGSALRGVHPPPGSMVKCSVQWSAVRAVGSGQYGSRVGVSGLADLRAGSQLDTHAAPPCDERGRAVRAVRGPGHVASQAHGARAPHPSTAPLRAPAPAGPLLLFALRLPLPRHREQVSVRPSSPMSTWCGVRRPPIT